MKLFKKIKTALVLAVIAAVILPFAIFALTPPAEAAIYTNFRGTVTMVNDNAPYTNTVRVEGEEEGQIYDFLITENSFFMSVDGVKPVADITVDDELSVYFIQPLVSTLIYPPQREASVFVLLPTANEARSVFVGRFNEDLISDDNQLRLNISDETVIIRQNGEPGGDVALTGRDLAVVYSISTRSIPAQTSPELIVILNPTPEMGEQMMADYFATQEENEEGSYVDFEAGGPLQLSPEEIAMLSAQLEEGLRGATTTVLDQVIDAPEPIVRDNIIFLPLRAIAEALGYDVFWEEETASIALGVGIRLQIGSYEYIVGRAAPITLHSAPFIYNNTTYVPMEFFGSVIGYFEAGYLIEENRGEIFVNESPEAQSFIPSDETGDEELEATPVQVY